MSTKVPICRLIPTLLSAYIIVLLVDLKAPLDSSWWVKFVGLFASSTSCRPCVIAISSSLFRNEKFMLHEMILATCLKI